MFLNGLFGLGKIILVYIIVKYCGYNVVEMNVRYLYYIIVYMKDFKICSDYNLIDIENRRNFELIKYFINNICIYIFFGTFFNFLFLY